jgi:hypothetical protein
MTMGPGNGVSSQIIIRVGHALQQWNGLSPLKLVPAEEPNGRRQKERCPTQENGQ